MPGAAGHDEHFLERLSRVSLEECERALSLYRDSELVAQLLRMVKLPTPDGRVAISLAHSEQGPFVIVARNGHFVTCLGAGMSTGRLPIVSWEALERLATKTAETRARWDQAAERAERSGGVLPLLKRLITAGDELSREEFVAIAAWAPLSAPQLVEIFFDLQKYLEDAFQAIQRKSQVGTIALRRYWSSYWALGHLLLLFANDDARIARSLASSVGPEKQALFSWFCIRQSMGPLALKALWFVGRLGKAAMPAYKQAYNEANDLTSLMNAGLGLAALGLRHARYRAEVGKVLARRAADGDALFQAIDGAYKMVCAAPEDAERAVMELFKDDATALSRALYPNDAAAELDRDLKWSLAVNLPFDFGEASETVLMLVNMLPWAGRAQASDFYLPEAVSVRVRERWVPERTRMLLDLRSRYEPKAEPVRSTDAPSRNDACPCGSGKKYKRCCGAGVRARG